MSGLKAQVYTIDELAQRGKTTVRNVRSYQEKGILPPPQKKGRAGIYTDEHLTRLNIIADLLGRGYTISNIAELLTAVEQGQDIHQILGFNTIMTDEQTNHVRHYRNVQELASLFSPVATAEQIVRAKELELIVENESGGIMTMHPRLIDIGIMLSHKGIPLPILMELIHLTRMQLDQFVNQAVQVLIGVLLNGQPLKSVNEVGDLKKVALEIQPLLTEAVLQELSIASGQALTRKMTETLVSVLLSARESS